MRTHAVRILLSAVAIAAMTLALWPLRPIAPDVSLGALYTIVVLAVAAAWGLAYAIGVSIASLLVFNFFYLPPVHTLSLRHPRDWTALVVYLVTGVVASELAARARRRAAEAERREREAALLADLAARLLERGDVEELAARVEPGNARLSAAVDALLALAAERERLQQEAVDAEALRRSDAVKTAVIRSVSHDLRTPLATIQAALDGIRLPGADAATLLETASFELGRLERLVENLLDLSRLEAGAAVPAPALWPADELVGQALGELPDAGRVETKLGAGLPAVRVDAAQIQRVLVNVLDNALKFSDDAVTIRADANGKEIRFRVEDRGPGVPAGDREAVFEPFHHASGSSGAGLGLAISRAFATANGGRLWVEPNPGGGAAFVLALPAERA
jgi:two-component system, OmpR family, sensor histidine kinase KdpD